MVLRTDESVHDGQKAGTKGPRASEAPPVHIQSLLPKITTEGHRVPILHRISPAAVTTFVFLKTLLVNFGENYFYTLQTNKIHLL
jgi:hypothetical protein